MKVLLSIILAIFLSQANAYTPAETCQMVQSGTFIADPTDCNSYYYCVNGVISSQGSCGKGLVYNSYAGACDYPENYDCPFNGNICANYANVYLADPLTCNRYIFCNSKGVAEYGTCPSPQVYNKDTNSCKHSSPNEPCSGSKCALVPNNKFVKGDSDYTSFTCFNGEEHKNFCNNPPESTTYVYDSLKGQCVANPNISDNDINDQCENNPGKFVASKNDCNVYYYCPNNEVGLTGPQRLTCPQRFHFDPDANGGAGACQVSWLVQRTDGCQRCGGYPPRSFVGVANSNCNEYTFCPGTTPTAEDKQFCPEGHGYFNEQTQNCQSGIIEYISCK